MADDAPPPSLWKTLGGRKAVNGYIATLALTAMAFPLDASYTTYMTGVLLALGITSGLTATEDVLSKRRSKDP